MLRTALAMLLLTTTPLAGATDAADDTDASAFETPKGPYTAQPTTIPYRSVVAGAPVPGALRMPEPPPRRSNMAGWVQRTLQMPDEPPPEPSAPVPSGDIVDGDITARTVPPPRPRPAPLSDNEIVVWGDRLEQARAKVEQRLTDLGYAPSGMQNGRTVWKPTGAQDSWKPRVIVDDDGWFSLRSPAVSGGRGQLDNAAMQPGLNNEGPAFDYAPPMASPGIGGQIAGKRQKQNAEARVARQIWDVVRELSQAQVEEGLIRRLEILPDQLDALWYEGRGPDGTWYPTVEVRQQALLTLWATRTRTVSGETVRRRIADYLIAVVDAESSLNAELVAEAEARCGCALFEPPPP